MERPPSPHHRGRHFEMLAAAYLEEAGWRVLDRNVREGREEIDLVVRQGPVVAFVEVRGRHSAEWGHPLETIGYRKRGAIRRVARGWIARRGRPGDHYRFDAVAVLPGPNGWRVEHLPDAFRDPGWGS